MRAGLSPFLSLQDSVDICSLHPFWRFISHVFLLFLLSLNLELPSMEERRPSARRGTRLVVRFVTYTPTAHELKN